MYSPTRQKYAFSEQDTLDISSRNPMLIRPGPSTPALFATKLVFKTRIDPAWKIAPPEVSVKSTEEAVDRRGGLVRSTKSLCNATCGRSKKLYSGVCVEQQAGKLCNRILIVRRKGICTLHTAVQRIEATSYYPKLQPRTSWPLYVVPVKHLRELNSDPERYINISISFVDEQSPLGMLRELFASWKLNPWRRKKETRQLLTFRHGISRTRVLTSGVWLEKQHRHLDDFDETLNGELVVGGPVAGTHQQDKKDTENVSSCTQHEHTQRCKMWDAWNNVRRHNS